MNKIDRRVYLFLAALFVILLIVDRYYWAQISQWREDQATNIWLGYTRGLTEIPVGLISSQNIPNPNGMIILGHFLSYLPSLVSVSLFLGILQMALLGLIAWISSKHNRRYLLLILLPPVSSVVLRSTSVEFWNQYLLTFINLLFLFSALKYLEKPSFWFVPTSVALICIAPSLYLAGVVNAAVITLLTIGILWLKRPTREHLLPALGLSVLIVLLSILLTWQPYFRNVSLELFAEYGGRKLNLAFFLSMLESAWRSFFDFPVYTAFQWADRANFDEAFKHASAQILSPSTNLTLKLIARLYLFQAIFAFLTFLYGILRGLTSSQEIHLRYDRSVARIILLSMLFIFLSYTASVWVGGPAWQNDSRLDQIVQFLPLSLFVIFLLPFLFVFQGKAEKIIRTLSTVSLILFITANLISGLMVIRDQLIYRGNELTGADVPLLNKMQVVDFIAKDWKKSSDSQVIPVDYRLCGGLWDWVSEFGLQMEPWYPAPFTEGRGFDYALKRQYGLTNQQEGIQLRSFGSSRYLVTYAFEEEPQIPNGNLQHFVIGRLRVSILEDLQE